MKKLKSQVIIPRLKKLGTLESQEDIFKTFVSKMGATNLAEGNIPPVVGSRAHLDKLPHK